MKITRISAPATLAVTIAWLTLAASSAQEAPKNMSPINWASTMIEKQVGGMTTETDYEFKGTNAGTAPVRITKVEKSCGCQSVEQSTDVVPPGGEITLKGKITLQPYRGTQIKQLTVITEPNGPQPLLVKVVAPEGVKVEPPAVVWEENDWSEKEIKLAIPPGNDSTIGDKKMLGKGFTFTEERTPTGIKLKVRPVEPSRSALRVEIKTGADSVPHYIRLEKKGEIKPIAPPQTNPTTAGLGGGARETSAPAQAVPGQKTGRAAKLQEAKLLLLEAIGRISEAEREN